MSCWNLCVDQELPFVPEKMGVENLFLGQEVQDKPGRVNPPSLPLFCTMSLVTSYKGQEKGCYGVWVCPTLLQCRTQDLGCGISLGFGMEQADSSWGSGMTRRGHEHQGYSGPCEIGGTWIKYPGNSAWGGLAAQHSPAWGCCSLI